MRIPVDPKHPRQNVIKIAADILKKDGVIIYPTDTIYGMGCRILSQKGLKSIFDIKKRDKNKPMSFICSSISQVAEYAHMSNFAFNILKKLLPGPYTFILKARREAPKKIVGKRKTVGIRMPDHPVCQRLVEALGEPLLTTSANISGESVISSGEEIEKIFGNQVDVILDGGFKATENEPSTVIDLTGDVPELIRAGMGDYSFVI